MPKEIERKFLVNLKSWQAPPDKTEIFQGYLATTDSLQIRIRCKKTSSVEDAFLTIKSAAASLSRHEYEYRIPTADAQQLLDSFAQKNSVHKWRYEIVVGSHTWSVDEFLGRNAGLVMAEIELASEDALFQSPEWLDREVTGDKRYYNSYLASRPFATW